MNLRMSLEQLGFEPARLRFTMRTAIAVCCAVLIAFAVGLEHPQWSGMTVWASSLPLRGHLLEKSLFRVLGSAIGAVVGVALLLVAQGQLWIVVVGLALWIGLAVAAGNLIRGFASYGAMLAGYTAAMVALLHSAESASPFAVGIDRMLTVLVGIVVALAIGWIFAAPGDTDDPALKLRHVSRRILRDLATHFGQVPPTDDSDHQHLLAEMAAIEDNLDAHAAGSLRSRRAARENRRLLLAQVGLLFWMHRPHSKAENDPLIAELETAAEALGEPCHLEIAMAALRRAATLSAFDPVLQGALSEMAAAASRGQTKDEIGSTGGTARDPHLHRDWTGAREAFLRATFVILTVGAIWFATGWESGAFMMLGTAVMITVFSTMDNPTRMLRQALFGQTLGVIGFLVCRWLVWPLVGTEMDLVLGMIPFVIFGGVLFGHRRTAGPVGFDYNMVILLLLQPVLPLAGSFTHSLTVGASVILGPALGFLAFLVIFPVDEKSRLRTLIAMMVHDIEAMAGSRGVYRSHRVWRTRFYHRSLRLARRAERSDIGRHEVFDGSVSLLLLASATLHIDDILKDPVAAPMVERPLKAALARLRRLKTDPARAAGALAKTATRLEEKNVGDASLLREAAALLTDNIPFIQRATR